MASNITAVILARAGRFRAGVHALLTADVSIGKVIDVDALNAALPLIQRLQPTLALIDFDLASVELEKLIKDIKQNSPNTQCLVLTDCQLRQYLAQKSGAHQVLRKGFSAERLMEVVGALTHALTTPQNDARRQDDFRNPQSVENL